MRQLTQEDLVNAPSRIKSAAVDSDGDAWGYSASKTDLMHRNRCWYDDTSNDCNFWFVGSDYDTTDWQNSAIDREVKS